MRRLAGLLLVVSLTAGCGVRRQPLALEPAPWQDGEQGVHDLFGADTKLRSSVAYRLDRVAHGGWRLSYEETTDGRRIKEGGVLMNARLEPTKSWVAAGGRRTETIFGPARIRFVGPGAHAPVARPRDAVDREQLKVVLRALRFTRGRNVPLSYVDSGGSAIAMVARVVEPETIVVPAGRFRAWRVELDTGIGGNRTFWFAERPPHAFLRYRWPGVSEIVLRSFQPSPASPRVGPSVAAPANPEVDPFAPIPIHWGLVLAQAVFSVPVMVLLPIILAILAVRRLRIRFRVVLIGAAGFIGSQVVHLPLNWLLGDSLTRLPEVAQWITLGLSAGLCEELARFVAMRYAIRRPAERTWAGGIVYGTGHGGIESIVFGLVVTGSVLNSLLGAAVPDPAARAALHAAAEEASRLPWYFGALGGVERIGAIAVHVGLSVLVMRAVTRRQPLWLVGAIVLHTALDAAIGLKSQVGMLGLEGITLCFGATLLALAYRLREPAAPAS